MVGIFNAILKMSIDASIVIFVVIIARILLNKAPKRYSYLLWSIVGFRLCCPISFNAIFSIFELGEPNAPKLPNIGGDIVITNLQLNNHQIPIDELLDSDGPIVNSEFIEKINRIEIFNFIVMTVWFIGMFTVLLYTVISYLKTKRMMSNAIRFDGNVFMSDRVASPFALGFIFPKIYIPFGLDDSTRDQILTHERCHIKRLDHIIKPLAFVVLAIHWFNPFCWLAFRLMSLDMEMSCDEKVLKLKGDAVMKKNYTKALLSFATNRRFPAPSPIAFSESNGNAKRRIKHALNWKKPKLFVNILSLALCIIVLASCGANAESSKLKSVQTEAFGDVPYNFVYVSNGDGTCSIKEVRVNKDYDGDIHLIVPEKAPNGDTVTKFDTHWGYNVLPFNLPSYMTYEDMQTVCKDISEHKEVNEITNNKPERDAKIFFAFYSERTNNNNEKYYVLEPAMNREERLRLTNILTAYGYDSDSCYEFLMNFLEEIPESEEESNELAREAFKYLYLSGNQITEVSFPETVKYIDYGAFADCESLDKIKGLSDDCKIQVISTETFEQDGNTIESTGFIYVDISEIEQYSDDMLEYFIDAVKE